MPRLSHTSRLPWPTNPWARLIERGARAHRVKRTRASSGTAPTMRATKPPNWCSMRPRSSIMRSAAMPTAWPLPRAAAEPHRGAAANGASRNGIPLAYLTHRAFFAGLEFYVDERVLVPRSPIAELDPAAFRAMDRSPACGASWTSAPGRARSHWPARRLFPKARVDALDISPEALAGVPAQHAPSCGLTQSVRAGAARIISPPCRAAVTISSSATLPTWGALRCARLPREYRHEPALGLASGKDGLDAVRAIFAAAPRHLEDDGILVVEVGNSEARAAASAFPRVPFVWPEISMGGGRRVHLAMPPT